MTIDQFTLLATSYDQERQVQRVRFKVACSKGTYVRTLAVDLAAKLGYPGVMSSLTRLKSGGFTLDQTLSLDDIQDMVTASGMVNLYPPGTKRRAVASRSKRWLAQAKRGNPPRDAGGGHLPRGHQGRLQAR